MSANTESVNTGGGCLKALAGAIAVNDDIIFGLDVSTSDLLCTLLNAYFEEDTAWSSQLNEDAIEDCIAKLSVTSDDPGSMAKVAQTDQAYAADSEMMSVELGDKNNSIGLEKSMLTQYSNAIGGNFAVVQPCTSLLKLISTEVGRRLA